MCSKQSDSQKIIFLKKMATTASVTLATSLALIKFAASIYTGSLAVLSSLIDSLSDIFSSVITYVAVRYSSQPASLEHRYGYGKAEALSALVQSAFIAGSGVFVIYEGVNRIFYPSPVEEVGLGIVVMSISMAATFALILFQKYVVKKTKSMAVSADSMHYMVDVITNLSIILSLIVVKVFEINWFDTLSAVFISAYLLINAYKIAHEAVSLLTDRELSGDIRKEIEEIVCSCPFCYGLHDLRTRDLGGIYMFELHIELDGSLSLSQAHEYTDIISEKIRKRFKKVQIIIHQDPVGVDEERLDNILVS